MKKKYTLLLVVLVALPFFTIAHAPKKISASYNKTTGILEVLIPHKVKNVKTHYIDEIVVTINEVETKKTYSEQTSKESHVAEFQLDKLESGTTILINASCSKLGGKKTQLTVE